MVNYFSALHKYDLEIRFHRRDLYQTSAFCGQVFIMKPLLKKINTWTRDRKQMWLPDAHLCYFILSAARPCVAVLLHGAVTSSAISPQMHQQNPADAPPESCGATRIRRTPTESCLHLQRDNGSFVYIGGTGGCHVSDLHQWRQSCHCRPPVQPVTTRLLPWWPPQFSKQNDQQHRSDTC